MLDLKLVRAISKTDTENTYEISASDLLKLLIPEPDPDAKYEILMGCEYTYEKLDMDAEIRITENTSFTVENNYNLK